MRITVLKGYLSHCWLYTVGSYVNVEFKKVSSALGVLIQEVAIREVGIQEVGIS